MTKCCKYDYNNDGNCHIHSHPGEYRIDESLRGKLRRAMEVLKAAPCDCHRRSDGWPCDRCVSLNELSKELA